MTTITVTYDIPGNNIDSLRAFASCALADGRCIIADLVRKFDLGIVVPPGDPQALADAFVSLVKRIDAGEPFNDRIASIRPLYHWDEVAKPLLEFCANPRKTAHLGDPVLMAGLPDAMTARREVSRLLYRTMTVLRTEGPKTVVRKAARKMLNLLRRARSG